MEQEKRKANATDYLANERTFLAWVRTSIGIMAFGFVVVKFSLFVKQISLILDKDTIPVPAHHSHYSAVVGIVLVALGLLTTVVSYIRYRYTNKQLDEGIYQHSSLFITLLTAVIFFISILLVFYLIKTA
jgi:putative membrane protein